MKKYHLEPGKIFFKVIIKCSSSEKMGTKKEKI
jgi:hypothetical protein